MVYLVFLLALVSVSSVAIARRADRKAKAALLLAEHHQRMFDKITSRIGIAELAGALEKERK